MSQIPATTPQELKEAIADGEELTILDVRQPHEFEDNHIEAENVETINVPLNELQTLGPDQLPDSVSDDRIVAVCRSGNRSSFATRILDQAGLDVENLQGGMRSWKQVASVPS
ncbi:MULTISPECIES: rhodanese-like domain-containing protein [Halobellus]|uniref:rhodanese-like domain-containing protein n=1 Tax=Halobellus TaxID=1073986 RepID=UPI00210EDC35|nr:MULTISPECIES: rhodanese-like domain-containing protein [Halobellus]MDQ2054514.1 rhodanese-like domain-containing protein [Halobellus sp. H-GB7]